MPLPFSLLPGAATQTSFRALIVGPSGRTPIITQTHVRSGTCTPIEAKRQCPREEVARVLRARSIGAYLLEATDLSPNEEYVFDVDAGPEQRRRLPIHTLPAKLPPQGMTVAVGSCFYGGYGKDRNLAAGLRDMRLGNHACLQIWAGDNLYLDVPAFSSKNAPYEHTVNRYLDYLLYSGYWEARALTPNWTTYDDHDFWNNYPERSLWLQRDDDSQRNGYIQAAEACLALFQSSLNPPAVSRRGNSFTLEVSPLSFFVSDVRANRQLNDRGRGRMMTEEDLEQLTHWAANLRGPGVLVMGQPLWIQAGHQLVDFNSAAFVDYRPIWQAVRDAPYDILVVSGDVHHSRVLRLSSGQRHVYEFVSSPACHIPTNLSVVLPFLDRQGGGEIDPPTRDPGSGLRVAPHYFFGTTASNSIGLLWLRPDARNNVRVGCGFVDYQHTPRWAAAQSPKTAVPRAARAYPTCVDENLFTLRNRDEYV